MLHAIRLPLRLQHDGVIAMGYQRIDLLRPDALWKAAGL
jgi:hypothetical protein